MKPTEALEHLRDLADRALNFSDTAARDHAALALDVLAALIADYADLQAAVDAHRAEAGWPDLSGLPVDEAMRKDARHLSARDKRLYAAAGTIRRDRPTGRPPSHRPR